jgi:hypothetical protein
LDCGHAPQRSMRYMPQSLGCYVATIKPGSVL